uniref:Chitin-binding type-2 domain-containing protein n=1 Tax=Anopheles maculatus TaxID=74869 RepID=A0A182SHY4_9DIPT
MLFNAEQEICDFPENVDCGSVPLPPDFEQSSTVTSETATTTEEETTESPSTTHTCPAIDDPVSPMYLPKVDDCSSYIMCYHGNPLIMQCPNGLEWNAANSRCDFPENAKCQVW